MLATLRLVAALLLLATSAGAQLLPYRQHGIQSPTTTMVTGDMNGDGLVDLLVGSTILVLLASDDGLQPPIPAPVPMDATDLGVGDLNADGDLDIAASSNQSKVITCLGNGRGGFETSVALETPNGANRFTLADFDGDGDDDLALFATSNQSVNVYLADGAFLVPGVTVPTGSGVEWLDAGDLDGDDDADLAVLMSTPDVLRLFLGDGAGHFTPGATLPTVSEGQEVLIVDVDEDDDADLLLATYGGTSVNTGHGDGTFDAAEIIGPTGMSLRYTDIDGNGYGDLAQLPLYSSVVAIQLGHDGPEFDPEFEEYKFPGLWVLAVLDTSGDGQADLVLGETYDTRVTVVLGTGFGEFDDNYEEDSYTGEPWDLIAADLDGDADVDLASANWKPSAGIGGVSVLLNDGQAEFTQGYDTSLGGLVDIETGDLNDDGDADLVSTGHLGVRVHLGDGAGDFGFPVTLVSGLASLDSALGDMDSDGDDDIATCYGEAAPGRVGVFLSDGAGGFSGPHDKAVGVTPVALQLADVDVDGHLDLVAVATEEHQAVTLLGHGGGLAWSTPIPTALANGPVQLVVGDLGSDGLPDLATLHDPTSSNESTFAALVGLGTGTFALQQTVPAGHAERELVLADVDGNGSQDLLSIEASGLAEAVALALNDGTGTFLPTRFHRADSSLVTVTAGDLDGDGHVDVATAHPHGGSGAQLSLYHNFGPPETWQALGQGSFGVAGIPMLVGHGLLVDGATISLELRGAAPNSPATLVIGASPLFAPLKGGVLVPAPSFLLPGLVTNSQGGVTLGADWPSAVPAGLQTWYQVWIADAAASFGYAASNGVTAVAP